MRLHNSIILPFSKATSCGRKLVPKDRITEKSGLIDFAYPEPTRHEQRHDRYFVPNEELHQLPYLAHQLFVRTQDQEPTELGDIVRMAPPPPARTSSARPSSPCASPPHRVWPAPASTLRRVVVNHARSGRGTIPRLCATMRPDRSTPLDHMRAGSHLPLGSSPRNARPAALRAPQDS